MPEWTLTSDSPDQTRALGRILGECLAGGCVLALNGTLGAGKTQLTQGLADGLDAETENVVSPTFTIAIPYEARIPMLHLDAYRIQSLDEVDELGLDELVENGVVLVVEWAGRIEQSMPPSDLELIFRSTGPQQREIKLQPRSLVGEQLVECVRQRFLNDSSSTPPEIH